MPLNGSLWVFSRAFLLAALGFVWPGSAVCAGNTDLVRAARAQIGVTLIYDGSYRPLKYPGGDLPLERGVCTDVIVRALRSARSLDLQQILHEDMRTHWGSYPHPRRWNLGKPDANIDHRRVPNLMTYFSRAGYSRPLTRLPADYLPGDIVAWDLGRGILHVGIVGDRTAATGAPLVIHNIGAGAREEDILFRFAVIGHYRLPVNREP
jgi:uncharacterized protein YijF (DUF1287 family)